MKKWISFALMIILGWNSFGFCSAKTARKYNQRLLWNPTDKNSWYEWWYYKVVDPKTEKSFYFVYGLVNPWDEKQTRPASKAFVSAGSFDQKLIVEEKFRPQHFQQKTGITLQIGDRNHFSENHLLGDIINPEGKRVRWDLQTTPDWEFNAMGWTIRFPEITNIYWYPAQASLHMTGWIEFDGQRIELSQAPGYQDRNWGRSFPDWWSWLVSNNFKNSPGTVLAAGGGKPHLLNHFNIVEGFTIGLRYQGKKYTWSLPHLDRITLDIEFGKWIVTAENHKGDRIDIEAYAPKEKFMILPFTTPDGHEFKDYEALNGKMTVRLYKKKKTRKEFALVTVLETDQAGIEYGSFKDFDFSRLFDSRLKLQ